MKMLTIDLNCDVGETCRETDDAILPLVSSCNVCCGAHAGNAQLIEGTIRRAIQLGCRVGAHPSWPDFENFGRRSMSMPVDEFELSLREQIELVKSVVEKLGGQLTHVKPHGALYHDVQRNREIATALIDVVQSIDPRLSIVAMAGSSFGSLCRESGMSFVDEAFGDRRYESARQLRSRDFDDALIVSEDDFRTHLAALRQGKVVDVRQREHRIPVQSICLHSDSPNARRFAQIAHELLTA